MNLRTLSTRALFALLFATASAPLSAQTISGMLLDRQTDSPIDLGLVLMYTEAGDSITATISDPDGFFSVTSPEPGSFILLASAFGYRESPVGAFDLGDGAEITIEFRIEPEPLRLDEVLVELDRPIDDHYLVRQGFIRRLQRGLGHFITPYEIEHSAAAETESLFRGIPGVYVRAPVGLAFDFVGESVTMLGASQAPCTPSLYIDGARQPNRQPMMPLSMLVPLHTVEAVEVYRRPSEIPLEYGIVQGGGLNDPMLSGGGSCGVLVFWTKSGMAAGQRPAVAPEIPVDDQLAPEEESGALPAVGAEGPPPVSGETIRVELDSRMVLPPELDSPWEGRYFSMREGEIIGSSSARPERVAIPVAAVRELQVLRRKSGLAGTRRAGIVGAVFGLGMYAGMKSLCANRCDVENDALFPAIGSGIAMGIIVYLMDPGERWERAPIPGG